MRENLFVKYLTKMTVYFYNWFIKGDKKGSEFSQEYNWCEYPYMI